MINSLYSATSALNASTSAANVTANNIANVNTPSFKSRISTLSDLSTGGVKFSATRINDSIGSLIPTSNNMDIAVIGGNQNQQSFNQNYSTGYNNFSTDNYGNLIAPSGDLLFTGTGGNVRVDVDGNIFQNGNMIGQITPIDNVAPTGATLLQGYMVGSNTDLATEMVDSIVNTNFFKANIATIQTSDEMLGTVVNLKA